jgi:hypothetical protein
MHSVSNGTCSGLKAEPDSVSGNFMKDYGGSLRPKTPFFSLRLGWRDTSFYELNLN